MSEIIENEIIHVGKKNGRELYTFNFSSPNKINEDDGSTFGGINAHE